MYSRLIQTKTANKLAFRVINRDFSLSTSLNSAQNDLKLGFVGTGKIAQAIILGLIKKEKLAPEQIFVSDANLECLKYLKEKDSVFQKYKINFLDNNKDVFKETNAVMLCVKPKDITGVLHECSNNINKNHLILSIAAGIPIKKIENCLPSDTRVIRIMTNTNALIQQSCSVFSKGTNATDDDAKCVKNLLEAIGTCENEVAEDSMDVITALSGSGPAYMYLILDALADGAVKMGITRQLAIRLAAQTMLGSASMVVSELNKESNGKHIMQMKEEVCSPGGTTIYGVHELERNGLRNSLISAIEQATNRAKQLSK